jgi:hypothetical protein
MMKKLIGCLLSALAITFTACEGSRSYTKMVNAQEKAIKSFLNDSGFVTLQDYPADGVFKPNEFYVTEDGIYINVVDSGNGNRAVSNVTTVLARVKVKGLLYVSYADDTTEYNNLQNGTDAMAYLYGSDAQTGTDSFYSPALFSALEYVGDSSEVRLLIPFGENPSYYSNQGIPLFYSKVLYRFEIR